MFINGYEYRIVQKQDGLYYGEMFNTIYNDWCQIGYKGYKTKGAVKRYIIPNEYKITYNKTS